MNEWVMLAIGLVLTVGTGLFVAAEFALVSLDRNELEGRRERGEKRLGPVIGALKITSTHLSSAQLGITLTTLLTGYTFEPAVSSLLESPLSGLGMSESAVTATGAVVGVALATLFSMVIGELVPKNFALAVPRQTAKMVVPFQVAFTTVFKPLVVVLNETANKLIRAMGIEPKEELSGARSADELTYLVRHSAQAGLLEEHDAALLDRTPAVRRPRRRRRDDATGPDDQRSPHRHRGRGRRSVTGERTLPDARGRGRPRRRGRRRAREAGVVRRARPA